MKEGKTEGGCREQESLYGNDVEANIGTNSATCSNMTDIDIISEPGLGRADKGVDSKNQSDSETKIPEPNS